MNHYELHIVGLTYRHDLEGAALGHFLAAVEGRELMLRHDPDNSIDALAIAAYDWRCRHVGYVAHDELSQAWQLLAHSDQGHLRATVTHVNREHRSLTCQVLATLPDATPPVPTHVEAGAWQWVGPLLPRTHQMSHYDVLLSQLTYRLQQPTLGTDILDDNLQYILTTYRDTAALDISFEVRSEVSHIRELLLRHGLTDWAYTMQRVTSQTGTRVAPGGDVAAYWRDFALGATADTAFTRRALQLHDDDLDTIVQSLPLDLFQTWLDMPDAFFAYVYYHHIPRHLLHQICSALATLAIREGNNVGTTTLRPDTIPPELDTPDARHLFQALQQAGLVDHSRALMPTLTRQTAMYIALAMSNTLWGETRWKPFERLWHTRNLAQLQQKMKDSGRLPQHATEIDTICRHYAISPQSTP